MKRVAHTAEMPESVASLIGSVFGLRHAPLRGRPIGEFLTDMEDVSALIVAPGDPVDAACIAELPKSIKLIASYSTGLDHVDVEAAQRRGIPVSNTPDVLTDATADIAMLLILSAVRGAGDAERMLRMGDWKGWTPHQIFGSDLAGRVLGIAGPGRIGAATALRAAAFGMRLVYWGRRQSEAMNGLGAKPLLDLDAFLEAVDVISLHLPSTPWTRRFINERTISAMRKGAVVVNTARGDLVDDEALIAALHDGRIGGAGLDVFEGEPALHPGYLTAPHVTLLPHIGSATHETRLAMGRSVFSSLQQHLCG
ncbi:2-hydroxyacid dehydrogenase [Hyphococcus sp.]|uniref:2-hydroxyacid dehydrogenase n=1 Tax=Hyphococcus sp. TaxID=2038636 RepID=UPI0035C6E226